MSATMWDLIWSSDVEHVASSSNGRERGDGYDVVTYRHRGTGRYFVQVAGKGPSRYYVADAREDADRVGAAGYTPGCGPGRYSLVLRPALLREMRTLPCQCGKWSGVMCSGTRPTVRMRYVPDQHRGTAATLRSSHGLTESILVTEDCARLMRDTDGEWCEVAR